MNSITNLTPTQLRHAASLLEQIAAVEKQVAQILGSTGTPAAPAPRKKYTMSAAGRARMAAAAKARWAKVRGTKTAAKPLATPRKKGGMSAAGRAKISAAAKARWAAAKAAGKSKL
jgi:hypothetical protein